MAYLDTSNASYTEMAATNNADSLMELGLIYATGRDGEHDMIAAHKWFNIAAFRGCAAAKTLREEVARDMTQKEIVAAQRDARAWLSQH